MSRYERYDNYARLNPGILRHRVTIYLRTDTKSALTGSDETSYTVPFLSVSAAMNPTGGSKFYGAARFNAENLESCMLRYQAGIDTTMQLEFGGKRYEILHVDDVDERQVKMMLALRRLDVGNPQKTMDDVLNMDNVTNMDTLEETV